MSVCVFLLVNKSFLQKKEKRMRMERPRKKGDRVVHLGQGRNVGGHSGVGRLRERGSK